MAIDPVCGMTVDEQTAPARTVHKGTTYYFCAPGCKRTFEKDPEVVLKGGPKGMAHAPVQMMPLRVKPAAAAPAPAKATSSVKPVSLTIPIEGMSCASCVAERAGHAPEHVGAPRPSCPASGFLLVAVAADDAGAVLGGLAVL